MHNYVLYDKELTVKRNTNIHYNSKDSTVVMTTLTYFVIFFRNLKISNVSGHYFTFS